MTRRAFALALALFVFSFFTVTPAQAAWDGYWQTADAYGSEYYMEVKTDGSAHMYYGEGVDGNWKEEGSGLRIVWKDGKEDFLFNGVMGRQRLSSENQSGDENIPGYSSFMNKVKALPEGL